MRIPGDRLAFRQVPSHPARLRVISPKDMKENRFYRECGITTDDRWVKSGEWYVRFSPETGVVVFTERAMGKEMAVIEVNEQCLSLSEE